MERDINTLIIETIKKTKLKAGLIHCITNHISINDCANIILAAGAKPIMAEHRDEVAQIVTGAAALVLNLGNISDARMEAMPIAAKAAMQNNVPIIIDPVGVACSDLRKNFLLGLLKEIRPSIIKGNFSEIKVLSGYKSNAVGVDVCPEDRINSQNIAASGNIVKELARKLGCTVMSTGAIDIVSEGENCLYIHNGDKIMGSITGTGCMCSSLAGAYASATSPFIAAVAAGAVMGICGEVAAEYTSSTGMGTGTFKISFFDYLYNISSIDFAGRLKITGGLNND